MIEEPANPPYSGMAPPRLQPSYRPVGGGPTLGPGAGGGSFDLQGMPELDEDTLKLVLDYLAEHYGPDS